MSQRGNGIFQSRSPPRMNPNCCLKQEVLIYLGVLLQKTLSCTLRPRFLEAQNSGVCDFQGSFTAVTLYKSEEAETEVTPENCSLCDNGVNQCKTRPSLSPDQQHFRQRAYEIKQINAAFQRELGAFKHSGCFTIGQI